MGLGLNQLRLKIERKEGDWIQTANAYSIVMAKAGTNAVRTTGRLARDNAKRNVAASGLGDIWQRSVRMKFYPKQGFSVEPEVYVFSQINYASVMEKGATIRGKDNYIWLPLPSVPPIHGQGLKFGGIVARLHMTPSQYVKKIGPLVTIVRPGKPPMLGAVVYTPRKPQPFGTFAKIPVKKAPFGSVASRSKKAVRQIIPLYIAVDEVTIRKHTDMEGAVDAARERMGEILEFNVEELTRSL